MKNNDIIIDSKLFKQNNKIYIIVFASYLYIAEQWYILVISTFLRALRQGSYWQGYVKSKDFSRTSISESALSQGSYRLDCDIQGLFKDYQAVSQH